MLRWGRFKANSAVVGIELQADGMAVSALVWTGAVPKIIHLAFLSYSESTTAEQLLTDWVSSCRLDNAACHLALAADQYQMLLVEPPEVPAEELRSAIRWRLKDLISIPLEQAAIDVFALPEDGTRAKKKMVYVVAAHEQNIKDAIALTQAAGVRLQTIDIGELAIRNLTHLLVPEETSTRSIAVARIRRGAGSLYIYRQGDMYLARSFALDYKGGLLDDLPEENLALELQRSVDYFERQMGQAPPTAIYLCGENIIEDKIGAVLRASLGIRIQTLDPARGLHFDDAVDQEAVQQCVGAIGAAMRQQVS